jgi:uncharacterized protein YqhQ
MRQDATEKGCTKIMKITIKQVLLLFGTAFAKPSPVGGQAIIEGVMMRSKHSVSMAVRRKNGGIACTRRPYFSKTKNSKLLGLPIIRGFINLIESLILGIQALNYSADIAMEDEKAEQNTPIEKTWKDTASMTLTMIVSFGIALMIFMYLPLLLSNLVQKDQNPLFFNIIAGGIRITFFLLYLWLISQWKDIRRIFEYHGAEHKAIFVYEDELPLTIENTRKYKTHHPRCGTSFLLIVAVVCIFLFAIIDGIITSLLGPYPTVFHRFLAHFALIPLVSGTSYEILKASDKAKHNPIVSIFLKPGLMLQKITTKEPDESQIEVAFAALKASL